jgi:type II restriction enzyme
MASKNGIGLEEVMFRGKGQASRLNREKSESGGQVGIFGQQAQDHDASIGDVTAAIFKLLTENFEHLKFRQRQSVPKREIHEVLNSIDGDLGLTLFIEKSSIRPDGGIIEVLDRKGFWRIVLIGESKHQGNDRAYSA